MEELLLLPFLALGACAVGSASSVQEGAASPATKAAFRARCANARRETSPSTFIPPFICVKGEWIHNKNEVSVFYKTFREWCETTLPKDREYGSWVEDYYPTIEEMIANYRPKTCNITKRLYKYQAGVLLVEMIYVDMGEDWDLNGYRYWMYKRVKRNGVVELTLERKFEINGYEWSIASREEKHGWLSSDQIFDDTEITRDDHTDFLSSSEFDLIVK